MINEYLIVMEGSGSTGVESSVEKSLADLDLASSPNPNNSQQHQAVKMAPRPGPMIGGMQEQGPRPRGGRGRSVDFPLRLLVASDMVGAIIGRGGATIRAITQQSRARVDVHRKLEHSAALEKAITVYGQPENCTAACKRIMEVMEEERVNTGKSTEMELKVLAHNNLIGRIIGKSGATIKKIMEDTDSKITVSSISDISSFNPERVITIKGAIPDISRAEAEVSSKLRAAYETDLQAMAPQSVMFPGLHPAAMMATVGLGSPHPPGGHSNYRPPGPGAPPSFPGCAGGPGQQSRPPAQQAPQETTYLYIPNAAVGAIIGTKGSHIRNIIKFSGSTVKIASQDEEPRSSPSDSPPPPQAGSSASGGGVLGVDGGGAFLPQPTEAPMLPTEAQRRVTIVGGPESQWKAQYLIFEKLREEGFSSGAEDVRLTVEILVPSAQVGRIIGKGGGNVREMQRLTGAVIKLPEQGTSTGEETSVHIIGPFYSTQSAQRRIRAMVAGPPGGVPPNQVPPLLPNGGGASSLPSSSTDEPPAL